MTDIEPKKPRDKSDPSYMRQAYIYTAILLLFGLLGGGLLAMLIIGAEGGDPPAIEVEENGDQESSPGDRGEEETTR